MNTQQIINKLKRQGYTVKIRHERPVVVTEVVEVSFDDSPEDSVGDPVYATRHELDHIRETEPTACFDLKGGVTEAVIKDASGLDAARGTAYCRPDDEHGPGDQFNRRLGSRIALGRAEKALQEKLNEEVPW